MLTYDQHVEAYADLNVLQNAPTNSPFQANLASQTASVNVHKFDSLINQIENGQIPEANGIQEIFPWDCKRNYQQNRTINERKPECLTRKIATVNCFKELFI